MGAKKGKVNRQFQKRMEKLAERRRAAEEDTGVVIRGRDAGRLGPLGFGRDGEEPSAAAAAEMLRQIDAERLSPMPRAIFEGIERLPRGDRVLGLAACGDSVVIATSRRVLILRPDAPLFELAVGPEVAS